MHSHSVEIAEVGYELIGWRSVETVRIGECRTENPTPKLPRFARGFAWIMLARIVISVCLPCRMSIPIQTAPYREANERQSFQSHKKLQHGERSLWCLPSRKDSGSCWKSLDGCERIGRFYLPTIDIIPASIDKCHLETLRPPPPVYGVIV